MSISDALKYDAFRFFGRMAALVAEESNEEANPAVTATRLRPGTGTDRPTAADRPSPADRPAPTKGAESSAEWAGRKAS